MLLWILKPIGHINQPTPYLSIRFENGVISMSQVFLAQYSDIPWHIPMILLWISYYINLHQLYLRTITSYRSNGSVQGPLFRMGRSNGSAPPVIGDVPWNIPMTFSNQKSPRMDHFGWCKKLSLFSGSSPPHRGALMLHVLTCLWFYVGVVDVDGWVRESWRRFFSADIWRLCPVRSHENAVNYPISVVLVSICFIFSLRIWYRYYK